MVQMQDKIVYFKNAHLMFPWLIYVESDVHDITKRLKEIDKGYFIMFNPKTQKFEVHHSEQEGGTYCLTLPFDELDSRAIDYVKKHRIENLKKIIAEMEEHNRRIEIEQAKKFQDTASELAKDIYTYCHRHTDKETVDDNAFTTRFV